MKKFLAILLSAFLFISFSYSQERELSDYEKYRMEQERLQYGQDEEVFMVVEDMPTFKGKDAKEFRQYIAENVRYPKEAVENNITGKVIVQFVVNSDGNVTNAEIVESVDPYLDAEAIRVVESSPKWKPGTQNGEKVNVQFTFPINFVLQEETAQTTVINNYYIDDYDWQFRINRRLYFGHSYYYSHYDPWYYDSYYYGGYYGYNYYPYYYGGYYGYPYYGYNYYPYYGHNHYYPNYRYNNSRYYASSSLGSRRYYDNPYYSKTYSSGFVTPNTSYKKNTMAIRPNSTTRSTDVNKTRVSSNINTTNRSVTTRPQDKSPYTRVLKDGSQTNRTYTPTYSKPVMSTRPSYNNTSKSTQQRTTTIRSTQPSRSATYNRPTNPSSSRSSSSYTRPSTSKSSTYTRPSSSTSSRSYSTPSRSSSSYSTPSRSSSSYSSGSRSSSSSMSSSSMSRSSGTVSRSSSGSRSSGKK